MAAGGTGQSGKLEKITVYRGDLRIMNEQQVAAAIRDGTTIEGLGLQSGTNQVRIPVQKQSGSSRVRVQTVLLTVSVVTALIAFIRLRVLRTVIGMEESSMHLTSKSATAGAAALGEGVVIDGGRSGARARPVTNAVSTEAIPAGNARAVRPHARGDGADRHDPGRPSPGRFRRSARRFSCASSTS